MYNYRANVKPKTHSKRKTRRTNKKDLCRRRQTKQQIAAYKQEAEFASAEGNPNMMWFAIFAAIMMSVAMAGCIQQDQPEKPPEPGPYKMCGKAADPADVAKKDLKYDSTKLAKKDYTQEMNDLADYFKDNEGDKATKGAARQGGAAYHVFEKDQKHIRNTAGTTSETQALFFNSLALYKATGGDPEDLDKDALEYIQKMMPHDGCYDKKHDGKYEPKLIQWLQDVSGEGEGDGVFGKDTPYDVYSTYDKEGKDTGNKPQPSRHSSEVYKYSSATDADQWFLEGLFWELQNPEVPPQEKAIYAGMALQLNDSLYSLLTKEGKYQNIMPFSHAWGKKPAKGDWSGEWDWTAEQAYTGYQVPSVWHLLGHEDVVKDQVKFLKDAQDAYDAQDDSVESGWFMPVYHFNEDRWGWDGYDPNTNWAQFQYRTFAHLAHYYYLSGDTNAKEILDKFYDNVEDEYSIQDGRLVIPTDLAKGTEAINAKEFDTGSYALLAQGLTYMAAKTGDTRYVDAAEYMLDELKFRKNVGEMKGSYSNADGTYGFHNAEALITFSLHKKLLG